MMTDKCTSPEWEPDIAVCKHGGWVGWCVRCKDEEIASLTEKVSRAELNYEQMYQAGATLEEVNTSLTEKNVALKREIEEWKTDLGRVVVAIRLGLTDKPSLEKLDKHIVEKLESSGYFIAQEQG